MIIMVVSCCISFSLFISAVLRTILNGFKFNPDGLFKLINILPCIHLEVLIEFEKVIVEDPEISPAVAALNILLDFVTKDKSETVQGLQENIKSLVKALTSSEFSVMSVKSACELFIRFISFTASLDHMDFSECKRVLSKRGSDFIEDVKAYTKKIARLGHSFIVDDSVILIHSHSRVVYYTLLEAYRAKKRFHVYITTSKPDDSGKKMFKKLTNSGISATLILDSAIGYILERVDMVLLGAEGVTENGGIINKIGSFSIAMCAKEMHKPVYVLAESFKFVYLCPLNQQDLPKESKYPISRKDSKADLHKEHPMVDYTPPSYITLLLTDRGILTPAAVSDVLLKLYL